MQSRIICYLVHNGISSWIVLSGVAKNCLFFLLYFLLVQDEQPDTYNIMG